MDTLFAILYRSEALIPLGSPEDRAILAASRRNNAARAITGFLYREDDVFYQWLEGPEKAVAETLRTISADHRHKDVHILSRITVSDRHFGAWSMGHADARALSLFDWAAGNRIALHAVSPAEILRFLLYCAQCSGRPSSPTT